MIPINNEHYQLQLFKRVKNSAYEYENTPVIVFKGRPASNAEIKTYRVQKGVNGSDNSVYIFATNLPTIVNVGDRITFMGQTRIVLSVGYYYELNHIINPQLLSEEQIIAKCPKGINLQ